MQLVFSYINQEMSRQETQIINNYQLSKLRKHSKAALRSFFWEKKWKKFKNKTEVIVKTHWQWDNAGKILCLKWKEKLKNQSGQKEQVETEYSKKEDTLFCIRTSQ